MKKVLMIFIGMTVLLAVIFVLQAPKVDAMGDNVSEREQRKAQDLAIQQKNIEEFKLNEKYQKQPICNEPLIVKIAGTSLLSDRKARYATADGHIYNYMNHRCEIKILENINKIMYPDLTISKYAENIQSELQMEASNIGHLRSEEKNIILANGVERLGVKRKYTYIFPPQIIPNINNQPVAFTCHTGGPSSDASQISGTSSCRTRYRLTNDLIVDYKVFGGEILRPSEEIIEKASKEIASFIQLQLVR